MAPEIDACGLAGGVGFHAGTVDRDHGQAVGYAVTALDQLPGLTLLRLLPVGVGGNAADGGGIDEHLGSGEGHCTGGFRIPLVPADQHAQGSQGSLDGLEAQVSGSEIELLVEERIVRDVHLAVLAGNGTVRVHYHGGIVIDTGGAALKEGEHDNHAQFLGQGAERLGGRAGNRFGQVAELSVLFLAEIEAVMQFLEHDQLRALGGRLPDVALQAGDVLRNVCGAVLLHHPNFDFPHYLYLEN